MIKVTLSNFIYHKMTGVTSAPSEQASGFIGQQAFPHLAPFNAGNKFWESLCPPWALVICRSQGTHSEDTSWAQQQGTPELESKNSKGKEKKAKLRSWVIFISLTCVMEVNSSFLCFSPLQFSACKKVLLFTCWSGKTQIIVQKSTTA